jgi:hypothetical protein
MKTFTLDEAQALLPVLEALLKRALDGKRSADQVDSELSELARRIYLSGGMQVDMDKVIKQRNEMEDYLQKARENVAEINAIGAQVQDLEKGLLDFPYRLEDDIVLLCWCMGEPTIEHWHAAGTGSDERQPLDERFRRRSAPGNRPN